MEEFPPVYFRLFLVAGVFLYTLILSMGVFGTVSKLFICDMESALIK